VIAVDRAHSSLWILTGLTVLAAGLVSQALTSAAGPASDVLLAGSVLLLLISGALLIRVVRYLTRAEPAAPRTKIPPRKRHG
jgi:hypothetical protein